MIIKKSGQFACNLHHLAKSPASILAYTQIKCMAKKGK
jgi:hypothetical protein